MDALLADLTYAVRSLLKRPLLAVVAAASVAIGIGANTAIFSVANSLLFRSLPGIVEPSRLVELGRNNNGKGFDTFTYPDFLDLRAESTTFSHLTAFGFQSASLNAGGAGRRVIGMVVSANYMDALGVRPALGRFFRSEEEVGVGQHPVVVISHKRWKETFAGDSAVIGRTLVLSRVPFEVIGVTPEGFSGHVIALQPDFYVPITMAPAISRENAAIYEQRGGSHWLVMGRLAPGVTVGRADAVVQQVMARLAREHPTTNATRGARVAPMGPVPMRGGEGAVEAFTAALSAVVALILLTVCANVAGMLLARAAGRQREIGVRLMLGSPRARIVRQLVIEALLIFAAGGIGGLAIAYVGTSALSAMQLPLPIDIAVNLRPDLRVLAIGFGVALVTGFLFGLLPALQVSNPALAQVIKDTAGTGGRRAGRLRRAFVVTQVAASIVLLAVAGLFIRALQHSASMSIGLTPGGVYLTSVNLALEGYGEGEGRTYQAQVVERVAGIPGVTAVALAQDLPLDMSSSGESVIPEDRASSADSLLNVDFNTVSAGYFATLGIGLRSGREFDGRDVAGAPRTVVVDSVFAAKTWPGEVPVGKRLRFAGETDWSTVVGVAERVPNQYVNETPRPLVYRALAQSYMANVQVVVRGAAGMPVAEAIRPAIAALDPAVSTTPLVTLVDYTAIAILPQKAAAALVATLGVLALFLSGLGVFGLMAHDVGRRTKEIGVRVAVGASPRDVAMLIYSAAVQVAIPGAIIGAMLALGLGRVLRSFLLGLSPTDPVALAAAVFAIVAMVAIAALVPARRAIGVEPMAALRDD